MIFKETKLKGAYVIDIEKLNDERGFFARAWCQKEFIDNGLESNLAQAPAAQIKIRPKSRVSGPRLENAMH